MDSPEQVFEQGVARQTRGDLAGAEALHRRVLELSPDHPGSTHCLGLIAAQRGQLGEALPLLRRAVELAPQNASYHANLGAVLIGAGRFEPAANRLRAALRLDPKHAAARGNLGRALLNLGRTEGSVRQFQAAVASGDERPVTRLELGAALAALGRLEEAAEAYQAAIALRPKLVAAHGQLGNTLMELGRLDEAVAAFRQAVALEPDDPGPHHNLGLTLLMMGRIPEGATEYEWRFRMKKPSPFDTSGTPRWDGRPLPNDTILLRAEQGLGDTIQFVRYAKQVRARCARVVLVCQPLLVSLLRTVPGVDEIVPRGQPMPTFAAHAPLMSLMQHLGTTLDTIPADIPYLAPDPASTRAMAMRLGGSEGFKVGLVWSGNPRHPNDRHRSIPLQRLAPILDVPGVRFLSLQTDERAGDLQQIPPGRIIDLSPHLTDFAETAAAVSQLDLVISVDTAVAHLAGALGRPAWTLLPEPADWRWLRDRDSSPWYPGMRLFRQTRRHEWDPVLDRVREALRVAAAELRTGAEAR